jgi:beta-glucosidase
MAHATFHFPRNFLWGTATAAHQVEGNNTNNNWWAWEQRPGKIADGQTSGPACGWWGGRWREDFDRAAEMGQNAHRLSIEWSRVQPTPDRWDEAALDRYREMLRGLRERRLTPLVSLHHITDPLWLEEKGGWENPQVVDWFAAYVNKTVEALKEYVSYWVTINEPNALTAHTYLFNEYPPGKNDLGIALQVMANQVRAHAAAYQAIHKIQPTAQVSIALHVRPLLPARDWSPLDRLSAGLLNSLFNDFFPRALTSGVMRLSAWRKPVPEARNTLDYLGLNYYTRERIAFSPDPKSAFARRSLPADLELSPNGFMANDPQGMAQALKWAQGFHLPIIITENGVEDAGDNLRPRYLIEHLHQIWRAVNENIPVKGYFHWTLVDNFEWDYGWNLRFGLWELDVDSQARRKRPSADLYTEICKENGISSEMVQRYAPQLSDKLFPG